MNWTAIWMDLFGTDSFFRDQYGVLGSDGGCLADCYSDECSVLESETEKVRSIYISCF